MNMPAMCRISAVNLYGLQAPWGRLVLQEFSIPVSVLKWRAENAKHPLHWEIGIIRVFEISEMLFNSFEYIYMKRA
jgi:hypothetical protein